jgi:hypothetical protein
LAAGVTPGVLAAGAGVLAGEGVGVENFTCCEGGEFLPSLIDGAWGLGAAPRLAPVPGGAGGQYKCFL